MKRWILLIFCINQTLDERYENIQREIEKLALNPTLPCETLFGMIDRLYDLKNGLINLRVLHNAIVRALSSGEAEALEKAAVKNGFASGEGATHLRGVNRILKRCEKVLLRYGFDESRLERAYSYLVGKKSVKKRTSG